MRMSFWLGGFVGAALTLLYLNRRNNPQSMIGQLINNASKQMMNSVNQTQSKANGQQHVGNNGSSTVSMHDVKEWVDKDPEAMEKAKEILRDTHEHNASQPHKYQ